MYLKHILKSSKYVPFSDNLIHIGPNLPSVTHFDGFPAVPGEGVLAVVHETAVVEGKSPGVRHRLVHHLKVWLELVGDVVPHDLNVLVPVKPRLEVCRQNVYRQNV